jgi:hypothetical protein
MMDLYGKGAIKPISPITVFPFEQIVDAFVFLRGGNHLGKVVISNLATEKVMIPVSPSHFPPPSHLLFCADNSRSVAHPKQ